MFQGPPLLLLLTHTLISFPLMGKAKRKGQTVHSSHHDNPRRKSSNIVRRSHSQTASKKPGAAKLQAPYATARAVTRPRVPFNESDRVLCIGEGASRSEISVVRPLAGTRTSV